MGQPGVDESVVAMLTEIRPHLDERQWRLLLGAQARALGRGGIGRGARLAGVHPDTVGRGARGLERGIEPDGRGRRAGGGRGGGGGGGGGGRGWGGGPRAGGGGGRGSGNGASSLTGGSAGPGPVD